MSMAIIISKKKMAAFGKTGLLMTILYIKNSAYENLMSHKS